MVCKVHKPQYESACKTNHKFPETVLKFTELRYTTHSDDLVGAYCEPDASRLVHIHMSNDILEQCEVGSGDATERREEVW